MGGNIHLNDQACDYIITDAVSAMRKRLGTLRACSKSSLRSLGQGRHPEEMIYELISEGSEEYQMEGKRRD